MLKILFYFSLFSKETKVRKSIKLLDAHVRPIYMSRVIIVIPYDI